MKKGPDFILLFFAAIYLIVHFIPDLGGADVMGAQWLYTSVVDFVVFGYLFFEKDKYKEAVQDIFNSRFTWVYLFYFIWAIISISYAMNAIEALVCLSRLTSTFLLFVNLSILLYKKDLNAVYIYLCLIMSFVLLYDALYVISGFTNNLDTMKLDANIVSLTGNNGNKNVMAASLLIKVPFALYLIVTGKVFQRIVGFITLFLGVFAVFIMNTRSTYVALLLIVLLYSITSVLYLYKKRKKLIVQLLLFILPVALAFFSANMVLSNAIKMQDSQGGYGSVTKRIGDINIASEENSRIHLWWAALDYFKKHPILGDGYGNWKLASIPYEKERTNDLYVPYHSHNDFFENGADLGIIGFVCYALLFILLGILTIKIWQNKNAKQYHFIATISAMALACYFIDAFFNFPTERTIMQTILAFVFALVMAPGYLLQDTWLAVPKFKLFTSKLASVFFIAITILTILPSIFINNQVYESLKVQKYVMGEIDADPKMALDDVKSAFPMFPNLSTSTLPIKALVARYYFRDKKYEESMRLLNESENVNPALHYNDFIRTAIYAAKQNFDSTAFYAYRAFYNWPRATSYYKNALFAAAKKKDTVQINKAYNVYKKYRDGGEAVNQYLMAMYEVKGGADKYMINILDSAFVHFPNDSSVLMNAKNLLSRGVLGSQANGQAVFTNQFSAEGGKLFAKGKYTQAANMYIKASVAEPNNYTHYENIAICYYTNKNYEKSLPYFDKAASFANNNTGKSEFFKAMSLVSMGKNSDACGPLQAAKKKNYPDIDKYIAQYCN
jgi:O-antigen ligase/tetratricopeptide (TPR) repeat protein